MNKLSYCNICLSSWFGPICLKILCVPLTLLVCCKPCSRLKEKKKPSIDVFLFNLLQELIVSRTRSDGPKMQNTMTKQKNNLTSFKTVFYIPIVMKASSSSPNEFIGRTRESSNSLRLKRLTVHLFNQRQFFSPTWIYLFPNKLMSLCFLLSRCALSFVVVFYDVLLCST